MIEIRSIFLLRNIMKSMLPKFQSDAINNIPFGGYVKVIFNTESCLQQIKILELVCFFFPRIFNNRTCNI